MPTRPLRPCPRCGTLTKEGGLCQKHRQAKHREIDARRPNSARRGYDAAWQRVRAQVLQEEPRCPDCAKEGRTVATAEVDHIDGDAWNRSRDNLRAKCKRHHSQRTARDQAFGRKGRVV